ncbi:hypothetical protein F5984_08830 [Rudanella paleaurantiibacter]|uniref:Uncharacterized protein n=1 Tax=Rudanella paleaurantiibacter TaxID=2614655 RepID=A0A7J5TZL6_9BACT|nr:hypothetical protein [Rudanella paleaurantiibacter]KAB7730928.1 hypothetical protein F5984_08830 [Rudanella paleaurantiibacter]
MNPVYFLLLGCILTTMPLAGLAQRAAALPTLNARYMALDVRGLTGFARYRYQVGDEIRLRAKGDRWEGPVSAVTDSTFDILVLNEIMDRTENLTIRFRDVDRIYRRKQIPFVTQLGVILPVAGVIYAAADFVNPKTLDGRTGRFLFDKQVLIPSGAMIVAGGIFYKISRPVYRVGKRNRLRAF